VGLSPPRLVGLAEGNHPGGETAHLPLCTTATGPQRMAPENKKWVAPDGTTPGSLNKGGWLAALLCGHVLPMRLSDVDLGRPQDAVIGDLLTPVGHPARHAGNSEDRRKQIHRDAHLVV